MDLEEGRGGKKFKKPSFEYCGKRFKQQSSLIFLPLIEKDSKKKKVESLFNPDTKIPLSHRGHTKKLNFRNPKLASFLLCRPCSDIVEINKVKY
jgi:hypothetical protein